MKKSRTVRPTAGVESPTTRRLPLMDLLIDTEAELFDLAVRSGLQVLDAMLEEDRTAICGPRYAHQARCRCVLGDLDYADRRVTVASAA